jgi:hypothetical protein
MTMNLRSLRITVWLVMLVVGLGALSFLDGWAMDRETGMLSGKVTSQSQGMDQARMISEHFNMNRDVLTYGGNTMSSSHFGLSGTVGQSVIGNTESPHFRLRAGYWQNFYYRIYLPVVLQS